MRLNMLDYLLVKLKAVRVPSRATPTKTYMTSPTRAVMAA